MSVAKAYAKALYEAASEGKSQADLAKVCDQIEADLQKVVTATRESRELDIALNSPVTTAKEKTAVVNRLASAMSFSDLTVRFLTLLAQKERLVLLPELAEMFHTVRLEAEGGVSGRVVSAEAMSQEDLNGLAQAFSKKLGKRVAFQASTDPSLLAGVKVTVNGVTYDGTLRSQLEQLKTRFVAGAKF